LTGEFGHQLSLMGADWLTVSGPEGAVRYRRAKWSYRPVADIRTDQQKKRLPFRTRAEQGITRLAHLNG
jgi:hypothetical protein